MATIMTKKIATNIGNAVKKAATNANPNPHMAAASRAIADRIPLVDFLVEIRDARAPSSSGYELLRKLPSSAARPTRIIVMNKADLADPSQSKEWMSQFEQQNCLCYSMNSHNKENVKQFLNFLQAQIRELQRADRSSHTTTVMLVGIPNVGKSALASSLHQIGRISAAEKGKLKHATVSPHPGETKDISSLKIGSHPNIYVLDTPGILPLKTLDVEVCSKLALTGAISDSLVDVKELAGYFLAILNSGDKYKKWEKLCSYDDGKAFMEHKAEHSSGSELVEKPKRQYPTDHTQDFIVRDVRRSLFETISYFEGKLEDDQDLTKLIKSQFIALMKAFRIAGELDGDGFSKVACKLLNLYRTGRLGRYTLDPVSRDTCHLC